MSKLQAYLDEADFFAEMVWRWTTTANPLQTPCVATVDECQEAAQWSAELALRC